MAKRIIVIGGGLAGTSAAYVMVQHGYDVTIIEKNDYIGGRIHSHLVDGTAVEMGAGFMTKWYANLWSFLASNELDTRLYRQQSNSGIMRNGKVWMGTPRTLMGSSALSLGAKLHALPLALKTVAAWPNLDPHAFWKADVYDRRSVAKMFDTRSGKEFLEYLLQPILNGYFYWTPEHTSEAMLLILCKAALSHNTYKMRGGLQRIPEKAAIGSTVLLEHTVKSVHSGRGSSYQVIIEHGGKQKILRADGIICATTASVVPNIFSHLSEWQRDFFASVRYSSTAVVARTYRRAQTRGDKGIAFPRKEGIDLSAITISPEPGAGSKALVTLKAYASGTVGAQLCQKSDKAIMSILTATMEPAREAVLMGDPNPLAAHVQKWTEALPMFDVGHFKRLRTFENGEIEDPGRAVVFAGDYLGGPFMEGAFTSGAHAAERLIARL